MPQDEVSYALGLSIGQNFKASGIKAITSEDFIAGLQDALAEREPQMTTERAREVINQLFMRLQQEESELNAAAGKEYQEIMRHKSGVVTLPSGLQYEIIKEGSGAKPKATDKVRVHYHGTLINGVVFDSSVERGEPAEFPLNAVIPGWTEILQLMPVGSKWRVVIPSELAYGSRGAGDVIRPNMTLIFEIELLDIV
ncbi:MULTISPECIES: FKBP-type peptidyl-prolyl cis-trans isomerase [Porphyromonas]|uniref:Peptidyl-prolyl cis-trans isomerase n=1 Tax=Porphyromonas asaccharolytica (strain ATCC 25260 / DSM 20707 / BCRC 10618 / CCUG 7834 / JCM 6326 / LMG 13178 / VPI 4198 / B440) TaxID=879243 RepID=F4KJY6_PORAD|nr:MULTISPECIES: FKBP-type peptidyl-prolyl cis-trans isomerase [Porphyromonas]AEE12711.1 Peptidylprolyl isomerase [Porphyromonas asaccharolytica DSM 20707]EFR34456.1 peptidyl-prolyl cis-trans isomerase, FKBP-type [Porphyromonas asaccharolytica PR426713P-I]